MTPGHRAAWRAGAWIAFVPAALALVGMMVSVYLGVVLALLGLPFVVLGGLLQVGAHLWARGAGRMRAWPLDHRVLGVLALLPVAAAAPFLEILWGRSFGWVAYLVVAAGALAALLPPWPPPGRRRFLRRPHARVRLPSRRRRRRGSP